MSSADCVDTSNDISKKQNVYSNKTISEGNSTGSSDPLMAGGNNVEKFAGKLKAIISKGEPEFVCGFGAAVINISITFPINKVMFRQMLHGISSAQAMNQMRKEGIYHLYRGILPPLCQKTVSTSLMFGMYEQYRKRLCMMGCFNPGFTMAVSSILAGFTEAILCPFERIQTILQDKQYHGKYRNTIHCAEKLWKYGVPEYYRGLSIILLRNGTSNVIFFGFRNEIKEFLPLNLLPFEHNIAEDFVTGAVLGAAISTIMYPLNVVKTYGQSKIGGEFKSMRNTFNDVFNSRGRKISGLFHGVHVNYTRALVSWGIINASYETLLNYLYR